MRGVLIIEDNTKDQYIGLCFDAYWKKNLDISIEKNIQRILSDCEINYTYFEKGIKDQKVKNELKGLTNKAFKLDVFGAPTFLINNKLFWGQDRLEYAIDEFQNYIK